jgi:hypothetical protein
VHASNSFIGCCIIYADRTKRTEEEEHDDGPSYRKARPHPELIHMSLPYYRFSSQSKM